MMAPCDNSNRPRPASVGLLDTTPLRRAFRVANVLLLVVAVAFVFRSTTVIRDQNCHDMSGSDLIAVAASCGAPTCNTMVQMCCLPEIVVR